MNAGTELTTALRMRYALTLLVAIDVSANLVTMEMDSFVQVKRQYTSTRNIYNFLWHEHTEPE